MAHGSRKDKIFETSVTIDDKHISRQQLPTKLQIVRSINAYTKFDFLEKNQAIKEVMNQITLIYERAAIPIVSEGSLRNRIKRLYDEYQQICKIDENRKNFEEKINKYLDDIGTLMDVAGDTSTCLKEDIEFHEDMRTSRTMVIGSRDIVTQRQAKEEIEREKKNMERKQRAREREKKENQDIISFFATETITDSDEDQNNDNLYKAERIHRRAKTGCSINIPYDILKNKNLNALMVRLNITPAATSALLKELITECGGNPSQVDLSYSSARKFHEVKVHEIATDIKFEYDIQLPTRSPLGWKDYG